MTNITAGGQCTNHQTLIVGWGTSGSTPYWIVQNQWGTDWGESGFFRCKRNTAANQPAMFNLERYTVAANMA